MANSSYECDLKETWNRSTPNSLVVICSDGRIQAALDEYLNQKLKIENYDRFYVPGGPGAFAKNGLTTSESRSKQLLFELEFLLVAHKIENLILIMHGASQDGNLEAMCADYRNLYPDLSVNEIRSVQNKDGKQVSKYLQEKFPEIKIQLCRLEVDLNDLISIREIH